HVLVRDREELPDISGTRLAKRLHEALDHGAEHLVRLEVERRPGQSRIASVEQRCAELVEPSRRSAEQAPNDGLRRRGSTNPSENVEIALDRLRRPRGVHARQYRAGDRPKHGTTEASHERATPRADPRAGLAHRSKIGRSGQLLATTPAASSSSKPRAALG